MRWQLHTQAVGDKMGVSEGRGVGVVWGSAGRPPLVEARPNGKGRCQPVTRHRNSTESLLREGALIAWEAVGERCPEE